MTAGPQSTQDSTNTPRPILVVDDDPDIRATVQEILEDEGYPVVVAGNGAEALQQLHLMTPSLILLDLSMPHMDGTTFRELQLQHPGFAEVPVVVMSATGAIERKVATMQISRYLRKPLDLDELLSVVSRYCSTR